MAKAMTMRWIVSLLTGCIVSAGGAKAQVSGTYGGQQSNGQPISILVKRFKGVPYVDIVDLGTAVQCRDGTSMSGSSTIGGGGPIIQGAGQFSANFGAYYINMSYTFNEATHTVSGFVLQDSTHFLGPMSGVPTKTTFCAGRNQAYAAVLDAKTSFDPTKPFTHYGCSSNVSDTNRCDTASAR